MKSQVPIVKLKGRINTLGQVAVEKLDLTEQEKVDLGKELSLKPIAEKPIKDVGKP